jgi:hypothetical protein
MKTHLENKFLSVSCSDFPTVFLGGSPSVEKAIFFPISWGEIPNSVVINKFVKIVN